MDRCKYAVVTGGTRGIGRAIAERFLREGYFVVAVYASDDAAAQELSQNYSSGGRLALLKIPVESYMAVCELERRVREICPAVDVLVCNSGTTDSTPFKEIVPEKWMHVLDVNLSAPVFLIQHLLPLVPGGGQNYNGRINNERTISPCPLYQLWRK